MHPFQYIAANSVKEVVAALETHGNRARCLAGGTDVLVQARGGRYELDALIDIKNVPEVMEMKWGRDGSLTIGAAVPCYQLYEDDRVRQTYPGLIDSAAIIGGIQIQSRASLGGNLCNASPSADSICSLITYNGVAIIAGPKGTREVPIAQFCTGPGRTVLGTGEFLVSIRLPKPPARNGGAYERFIPRNEMDIAVVGVSSDLTLDAKGNIQDARIALAAVGPTPVFAQEASQFLSGKAPTEANFTQAGELAKKSAKPITDMRGTAEYRTHLVGVLTRRTLTKALSRAQGAK